MIKQSTRRFDGQGSTDSSLLRAVSEWNNEHAWARFRNQYDPKLRRWCRYHGLDSDSADEVCQIIWIELANRMKTLCYDPNQTFRKWLRHLCAWRVGDYLRRRGTKELIDSDMHAVTMPADIADDRENSDADLMRLELLEHGEIVQRMVRQRVRPQTWEAFWLVAVQDWTVARTAKTLGMTRVSVYAARQRVAQMLREEGKRVFPWKTG